MTPKKGSRKTSRRKFLGLMAGGLAVGAVAGWQFDEAKRLTVERHRLQLPRWNANGFRIAQISDLHLVRKDAVMLGLGALQLALNESPDVVVITGDFVHGQGLNMIPRVEEFLRGMPQTGIPILAILGNHDYWIDQPRVLIDTIGQSSIRMLRNEGARIGGVKVLGIDDGIAGRDRHHTLGPGDDRNVISLFHEPDFVDRIDRRASLMLAGHSHGGQICLPGNWPLHTPRGARTYIRGYYPEAPVPLYVNRGIGTVGVNKRTFCAPEITLFELHGDEQ